MNEFWNRRVFVRWQGTSLTRFHARNPVDHDMPHRAWSKQVRYGLEIHGEAVYILRQTGEADA